MSLNTRFPVERVSGSSRSQYIGRFAKMGFTVQVTPDVENPWIFTSFMVRVTGDVVIIGVDDQPYLLPACIPGTQYFAWGKMIRGTGTTATGIFVFGGA